MRDHSARPKSPHPSGQGPRGMQNSNPRKPPSHEVLEWQLMLSTSEYEGRFCTCVSGLAASQSAKTRSYIGGRMSRPAAAISQRNKSERVRT